MRMRDDLADSAAANYYYEAIIRDCPVQSGLTESQREQEVSQQDI
jgi:hypothetical protein